MAKNDFTRSNVNESTLAFSQPAHSGFDLSHSDTITPRLGMFHPLRPVQYLPGDVLEGSLAPNLSLEKIVTPSIGRLRLDTHTFAVNFRRIDRDFTFFKRDTSGTRQLPSFDIFALQAKVLTLLLGNSTISVLRDNSVDQLKSIVISRYSNLAQLRVKAKDYGYLGDFYAVEKDRIMSYPVQGTKSGFIVTILAAYFGETSICEQIGAPTLRKLSAWASIADGFIRDSNVPANTSLYNLMTVRDNTSVVPTSYRYCESMYIREYEFRAIYACWYDYLRNFKIEKRDSILDPDMFDSTSLLGTFVNTSFPTAITSATAQQYIIWANALQLLLTRWRSYNRDFMTTIQTDDAFRHVYAPIYSDSTSEVIVDDSARSDFDFNSIQGIVSSSFADFRFGSSIFPLGGLFASSNAESRDAFRADMMTMRRTGMLEKWLARNYFMADTYTGQIEAHFGVTPSDTSSLLCQYLGGDEQMISGDQQIANVTTSEAAAGTRTMYGGVQLKDNFRFSASEDGLLVSFVSLMPLVRYDAANPHLQEITLADFVQPEFADDSRVEVRTNQLLRGFERDDKVIGFVPRYYHYRVIPDSMHGKYLTDYRSYDWFRDWANMRIQDLSIEASSDSYSDRGFMLNPYSMRVHLSPDAFLNLAPWDSIAFGEVDIQLSADRPLPAAIDFI